MNACNSNLEFLIFSNRNCKVLAFFQLRLYFLYYFFTESISFDFSFDKHTKAQISLCKWIYFVRSMKFWVVIYGVITDKLRDQPSLRISLAVVWTNHIAVKNHCQQQDKSYRN